ncbi:hypothetical protein K466DRAFT_606559 [Polyporus arcularius HHB13444]|uniref:Uncharacterized protein n=1 Tax=Polyporus arcularius HHB13444 TaxID=1314778 RepID=A0A5C3NPH6_9APHY|nr:hypothetical protein K466DRAFT_606559 [Polyporus arcularius HHB13444]
MFLDSSNNCQPAAVPLPPYIPSALHTTLHPFLVMLSSRHAAPLALLMLMLLSLTLSFNNPALISLA